MALSNTKSIKIIFFGTGSYVLPIIKQLSKDFEVPLVLTTETLASQGLALRGSPVIKFCKESGIECISVKKFDKDVKGQLSKVNCQIGVLANFGLIIPKSVLDIFPKGIINVHPSLLPKYRGPTPGQTAILNGDEKTGVTIIKLDEEVDHGPILAQQETRILSSDTASTLYERLFKIGSRMLLKTLPIYLNGELRPTEQNHSDATFTKTLTRNDGFIDLSSLEIRNLKLEIARRIRAFFPWPGVWTMFRIKNNELRIRFLPDKKIQVEGKNPMSYKDFLNGYPKLESELVELLGKLQ